MSIDPQQRRPFVSGRIFFRLGQYLCPFLHLIAP